jgi:hypothetical protein
MGIITSIIAGVKVVNELYDVAAPLVEKLLALNSKAFAAVKNANNSIKSDSDIANIVKHFISIIESAALAPKSSQSAIRAESIMVIRKVWLLIDKFTPDDVNVGEQLDDILAKLRDDNKDDAKIIIRAENVVRGIIKRDERGEFKGEVDVVIANVMQVMMDIIDLAQEIAQIYLRQRWTKQADAALDAFQAGCACFVHDSSGRNLSYKTGDTTITTTQSIASSSYSQECHLCILM